MNEKKHEASPQKAPEKTRFWLKQQMRLKFEINLWA